MKNKIEEILREYPDNGTFRGTVDQLLALFKKEVLIIIGEDESEIQDMDRKLYFVGKNDLRREQRKELKALKKD